VVAPEGAFKTVAFEAAGKPHEFVFAGLGPVGLPEHLADVSTRIVSENASVFGDEAALPYEAYRFLVLVSDGPRGGLEHDASSVLQHPRTGFRGRELEDFLGLVAHEHFHVWNVRRMRPVSLVDPDMEREVDTSDLWVAEGMTAYFDDLVCRRVGAIDEKRYLDILAGHWTTYLQSPGRLRQSLSESAADAWIRLYRPHPNLRNVTQNYYTHGSLAAACIDAMVRFDSDGERELDDVLRDLYARSYQAGRGFERRDIVAALDAVAPGRSWADEIRSLIDERSELPFVEWMERAYGLVVKTRGPKRASLGIQIRGGTTVVAFVRDGEAGRAGGLVPDDEIVAVDGLRIRADNWSAVFDATLRPGRKARLLVARQGRMQEIVVEPTVDGVREVRIEAETEATAHQRARRERWLGVRREARAGRGSGIEAS
jgi:predicted metalloprotease with PDZ domain